MKNPTLTWVRGLSWSTPRWGMEERWGKNALNILQWRQRSDVKPFIGFRLARPV